MGVEIREGLILLLIEICLGGCGFAAARGGTVCSLRVYLNRPFRLRRFLRKRTGFESDLGTRNCFYFFILGLQNLPGEKKSDRWPLFFCWAVELCCFLFKEARSLWCLFEKIKGAGVP